jgi:hypothetical protein
LYTLYLITKDSIPTQADYYAEQLKSRHPNSTFARILINPDYLQESSQAAEKQKVLYSNAYQIFQGGYYDSAKVVLNEAFQLGETSFYPTLKLLEILIIGETEDITRYQYSLQEYIKTYGESELARYAKKLLDASKDFEQSEEKRKGIGYIPSFEEPHYFVIVHRKTDNIDELASSALTNLNDSHFSTLGLKTSNLVLNDDYAITFVSDLAGKKTAVEYFQTFTEKLPGITDLRNHKFDNFVITKDNFDIFYRTKGLNEYIRFFEKNYQTKNQ